jgi:hypothetical protein
MAGINIPPVAIAAPQELNLVAKAMNNNQLVLAANQSGTTVITGGANQGSGATFALGAGSGDASGQVTFNTGTGATASGNYFNIAFANAMPVAPAVVLYPANAAAATIPVASGVFPVSTTTGWSLNGSMGALGSSTTYKWNYIVVG